MAEHDAEAGGDAAAATHTSNIQRVKVYCLADGGKWDDQGTGHVSIEYIQGFKELGLTVLDEEDNSMLLVHRITSDDIYRRQDETIILWRDHEAATELALSFLEAAGCSYIWANICDIQRDLKFRNLGGGTQNGGLSRGKKRDRGKQGIDPAKRDRDRLVKVDDSKPGSFNLEDIKSEVAKVTEKGGLPNAEAVDKLVHLMQLDRTEQKIDLAGRVVIADVIAATESFDALARFVQSRGLPVLDSWVQEAHKGNSGDASITKEADKRIDELLLALLRALEKLPINLSALQSCSIGKSVNHLRSHKNLGIQVKAKSIVEKWKKRVDAEMKSKDAKPLVSGQFVTWAGKAGFQEVLNAANKRGGSIEISPKNPMPTVSSLAEMSSNGVQQSTPSISGAESSEIMKLNILERIVAGREEPSHLDLPLLYSITENFSKNRRIGQGGCGEVYKGILRNADVAVKKLFNNRTIKDKMFHREVKSLITVRHENIVRFLGYCSFTEERAIPVGGHIVMVEIRERLLCFEYISNGSLERHITDELRGLEWHTRFDIIVGISKGLCYLHKEKNIAHMDLKPANILLDDHMVPKITDFGLSRLDNNPQAATTSRLISPGYSAPEYFSEGKSSKKSDIYSLGVIILELVSGSKNNPNITKPLRMEAQVRRKWRHRWIKSSKHTPLGYQQVTKCFNLAHKCMERDPTDRPDISDIVQELNDSKDDQLFQVIPSLEDMLGIEPLEIQFPFELYWQVSHTVELSNDTDDHFAFVTKPSLRRLRTEPDKGIVPPRSKCSVTVTMMQAQFMAFPNNRYKEEIIVLSTRVDGGLTAVDITKAMFIEEGGKVVDEVNVIVVLGKPPLDEEHYPK